MITARGRRDVKPVWKVAAFCGMTLAGVVFIAVVGSLCTLLAPSIDLDIPIAAAFAMVALVVTWASLALFDQRPLAAVGLGLDRPWIMELLGGAAVGVGIVGVTCLAIGYGPWGRSMERVHDRAGLSILLAPTLRFLFVAITEELICRGYVFQVIARKSLATGLILSGTIFALLHFGGGGVWHPVPLINLILAHVMFAVLVLRSRGLWWPIGVHWGWNMALGPVFGMVVSGGRVQPSIWHFQYTRNAWTGNAFGPEGGLIVTVVLAITILVTATRSPSLKRGPILLDRPAN